MKEYTKLTYKTKRMGALSFWEPITLELDDDRIVEDLNCMARDGWRFVGSVSYLHVFRTTYKVICFLERDKPDS